MFSGLENPVHLLVILVVVLLVFGPKRLPGMGRSLGHGMRQFRESLSGSDGDAAGPERPTASERPTAPSRSPESE